MTTISEGLGLGTLARRYPQRAENRWCSFAHRRLSAVLKSAKTIPFDDSSPIVFFSDLHRGDDSRADAFARNKELFLHALTHDHRNGFTHIEVGDGDEPVEEPTLCGHTHHPMSAGYGAPPYFNTGSCMYPGYITGLELQGGEIMLVKWTVQPGTRQSEAPLIKPELIAPPKKLRLLGEH
jgi:hypothetical protein